MAESKSQSRIVMKFAFLIPYYNHPKTIKSLVDYLSKYNIDIIVVDDGSDHKSKEALKIHEGFIPNPKKTTAKKHPKNS